jgi:uncharacterized protein YndB with AHSA1/START domain
VVQARQMSEATGFLVEREIRIEASPETVFEFFTDPEKMKQWKGSEADLDAQPGGTYRVTVMPVAIARGEYVRVEPPHFVSFTWGWESGGPIPAPGESLVEVSLRPDGTGTIVELRHSGLPTEESATEHGSGWTHFLGRLSIAAAGGDPGRDPGLDRDPSS